MIICLAQVTKGDFVPMLAERESKLVTNRTLRSNRITLAGLSACVILLALASLSVFAVACGGDPTAEPMATSEPVATASPDPTSTTVPEPTPTSAPDPTPTSAPDPTSTTVPEPTPTSAPDPTPTTVPEPTPVATPEPTPSDDDLTMAYTQGAIDFYMVNGLDATVELYRTEASIVDGRSLILLDVAESVVLVFRAIPNLEGQYFGPGSPFTSFKRATANATEEGSWYTSQGINPDTREEEPRRIFSVLHDGLVFAVGHSVLVEDVSDSTQEYVDRAIAKYEGEGLDATIAHYNSQDSLDGQFYLFLIGEDDLYLAHPIFPHLIGTDIKDVVGSDGQELGREISEASTAGIWVEYLWPHPISRREQQKVTWAVRHDGLIFASGYYAGGPESGPPPWQDADPEEYTVAYVERAIERYERDGLESMLNYYNSVASFEGEWYLFATDENDIYHVHPLLPQLIGTDIKDVVGSDGYQLGIELAKATDEGVWVEYLWPHPVTLKEVPKAGFAVRRDGMLFASGYYVPVEDPAAQTRAYVQQAIDYYRDNGLDAIIARYNDPDSLDGQWSLTMADENDIVRVAILAPHLIGSDLKDLGASRVRKIGEEIAAATEEGRWISFVFPNTRSSETLYAHTWSIRYDGLLFTSRYYNDRPEVVE